MINHIKTLNAALNKIGLFHLVLLQSVENPGSRQASEIARLFHSFNIAAAGMLLLVTGLVIFVCIRYRAKKGDLGEGSQNDGNRTLEGFMNTTQFGFVKSYLPNRPKPMGPIYEPEAAANAVLYAACHRDREVFYGSSTYKTILGNKMVPAYLDKLLAKKGYAGQQTDEPQRPDHENNLWNAIPGDHGARGPFAGGSKNSSPLFKLKKNKVLVAAGITTLAMVAMLAIGRRSSS